MSKVKNFLDSPMHSSPRAWGGDKSSTINFGNKERFDKEQIGIKELFPVTNLPFTS